MYYINGEWHESDRKEQVINPATLKVIDTISVCGAEETKAAIAAAKEAFKTWKKSTGNERSTYLFKAVKLMKERVDELAQIITLENGKPLPDAKREVYSAISYLDWYAEEAKRIYGEVLPASHQDKSLMVIKQPVGVCGAITPWNFPLSMITRKIAPALAAGCTIVLKPALQTPLSAIKVFECFHEAGLPKGVVNLVIGPAEEIGRELTSSTDVRKLTFTGSTFIGKKLVRDSADTMKKVSMELGGHAPYIVFEDADIDLAVEGVMLSKFKNSGQTCISTNRVYAHKSIAKEFAEKLAKRTAELKIGDGLEEGTDVGPLINEKALETMKNQVADAVKHNAEVVSGGKVYNYEKGDGYFFEPTVILNATEDMVIATEETFGPIAPVFTFESEEEVVEKANNTLYGLAAYCYTKNLGRGMRMMRELEFGIIGINDPAPIVIQAPFGGIKESGMGKEGGKFGLEEYLEEKFVSIYEK
ncbi:NAD-dependent succinate-semialdehyde dehydrogenase [Siminovitchia fortis]|uniref:NAD-dependent succinate-semialdehyde dehydrogenase n=1 Tax=Siminovitchia fortis TaxID=254758 RepID=A0A443ILW1_9BACI|nr:NAD-dependent succinate-semialdehyde dehydrogenase [Siminovitchia fortis]RWR06131.1 NAD-dependent succinate-semialdehyde dehydrogenase [Siminovitchia fortis]WHY81562.1 NAD-dependent succinate-semialdehyde dehydrogenase [Siminovitchia fortis]